MNWGLFHYTWYVHENSIGELPKRSETPPVLPTELPTYLAHFPSDVYYQFWYTFETYCTALEKYIMLHRNGI